jgi:hypothetical protein
MPMGSPGMEMEGMGPDRYEVVLFGASGRRTFALAKVLVCYDLLLSG